MFSETALADGTTSAGGTFCDGEAAATGSGAGAADGTSSGTGTTLACGAMAGLSCGKTAGSDAIGAAGVCGDSMTIFSPATRRSCPPDKPLPEAGLPELDKSRHVSCAQVNNFSRELASMYNQPLTVKTAIKPSNTTTLPRVCCGSAFG